MKVCCLARGPGMRLDYWIWPEKISSVTLDYTFDVHLIKLGWSRVLELLRAMYGVESDQYKWCVAYKDTFVTYLPTELRVSDELLV